MANRGILNGKVSTARTVSGSSLAGELYTLEALQNMGGRVIKSGTALNVLGNRTVDSGADRIVFADGSAVRVETRATARMNEGRLETGQRGVLVDVTEYETLSRGGALEVK